MTEKPSVPPMPIQRAEAERWERAVDVAYRGVLGSRIPAFLIDIAIITVLYLIFAFAIFVLGFLSFGLAWTLYFVLGPATAILYSAITVGGRHNSTIGMRLMGLRVVTTDGGRPDMVIAAAHALLFYVAAGTFVLWLVVVGTAFLRRDRRLGHDLLTGLVVINRP